MIHCSLQPMRISLKWRKKALNILSPFFLSQEMANCKLALGLLYLPNLLFLSVCFVFFVYLILFLLFCLARYIYIMLLKVVEQYSK